MKYTAREGGDDLNDDANNALIAQLGQIRQSLENIGLHQAINLSYDMPTEWHQLKQNGPVELTIDKSRLPFMAQAFDIAEMESVMLIA